MRSSISTICSDYGITNQVEIPIGVVVQPMADLGYGESYPNFCSFENEPIRCQRCKAYVNLHWQWVKNGSFVICNICKLEQKVDPNYYSSIDNHVSRLDKFQRCELYQSCYDIQPPANYIKKSIENIKILLVIEMSPAII